MYKRMSGAIVCEGAYGYFIIGIAQVSLALTWNYFR
jgi:hypothetical protein